ncbi:MAG: slipin family protein [Hyphomonadaceae bacterium]|nr:MAG: band 7 protein [Caulobacteraceae bacterium]MBT9446316.1 slipin family protein [Hyphomonadaceae bacterium]TPW07998.1 MAG: band 7 protein [Alphaproteobacteria bacterium]
MKEFADTVLSIIVLIGAATVLWMVLGGGLKAMRDGVVTVYDYEAGLKFVRGKLVEALPPGRYQTWARDTVIERVDLREQSLTISGQEMLSQDNLPVRVTVIVRWKITDPLLYKRAATNVSMRLYEAAQVLLRKRVGALMLDALLADRGKIDEGAIAALQAEATRAGIAIAGFDLRDLTLVGAAKQAFSDLWRAQKEGLAALERARGEQAALRSLANAARMLKGNPELMNLRVLQALQGQAGKTPPTVILGGAPGLVPVSRDPAPDSDPA